MPNNFQLPSNYAPLLDEVYRRASVVSDLTGDPNMAKAGVNVNEICYPQIEVSGLGDYKRNGGYTKGGVKLQWKTVQYNYDRGTKLEVDVMDDQESFNIAFGQAGAALMREKVAPEADAFTFATLAGLEGISIGTAATFTSGAEFLEALLEAKNTMDEDEVDEEGRILYVTPTLLNSVMALDTTKSREALNAFSIKKAVPQSRFYTAIDLLDGESADEEAGHYQKSEAGKEINFMIIHKPAIIKYDKHIAHNVISPDNNADSDGYIMKYRKYGIVDAYINKRAGIYLSHKA